MENIEEQKKKATALRKEGNFREALPIYEELWKSFQDRFDGAGLLHCLRKLELFDEALPLADDLVHLYPDFKWCKVEIIWTYIYGILKKFDDSESLENVLEVSQKIMSLNPKELAAKMVVFKVLDSAKAVNDWKIINEWVLKLDPKYLSSEPMVINGKEGWSDQARWYNFRINGLLKSGNLDEAILLVDEVLELFPKQKKFFLRLKALALQDLGRLSESEKIYENLCSVHKPDWWLLYEYSKVIKDLGRKEDSLKIMYKAASSNPKLELMVSLFEDIGILCKELGMFNEARDHMVLLHFVRLENGWNTSEFTLSEIMELNDFASHKAATSLKEARNICRDYWNKLLNEKSSKNINEKEKRTPRRNLLGVVSFVKENSPFCFIKSEDQESIFCYTSNLPFGVQDGDLVIFDAFPSFDPKKKKESWKASKIRIQS